MSSYTASQLSDMLAMQAEEVAAYLFPAGVREGNEFCVGSLAGEAGKSLKISLSPEKAGIWSDFSVGVGGDILDLWQAKRNISLREAISEVKRYLCLGSCEIFSQRAKSFVYPSSDSLPDDIISPDVLKYLTEERKLLPETIQAFGVTGAKGEIIFPFYKNGELLNVKYLSINRPDGKKKIKTTAGCQPVLFGWQALDPTRREVAISEGEFDGMSLHQYGIPALSVPFGAGTGGKHQWIELEYEDLAIFDTIYICMDNDKAGHEAEREIAKRLGLHRCKIVRFPFKDANECAQNNVTQEEMLECIENAKTLDPIELTRPLSYEDAVLAELYNRNGQKGYYAPFDKVKNNIMFRNGELSLWTGINGHGKSQFLGQVMLNCMLQGAQICIASLELLPAKMLTRLVRQAAGLRAPTDEYTRAILEFISNHLLIFDHQGAVDNERLLEVFRYAIQRYSVDVLVIDSLMLCGFREDDYHAQKRFMETLCAIKKDFNCHIHLIVHPRKSENESFVPGKMDMKGTGALTDLADNCFTVWRNKQKEIKIQEHEAKGEPITTKLNETPDVQWVCDKQRYGEWEGVVNLWFNKDSFQFLARHSQRPYEFVKFTTK